MESPRTPIGSSVISSKRAIPKCATSDKWLSQIYLTSTEETIEISSGLGRALILKVMKPVPKMFERELVVKELMEITGEERELFICKRVGPEEHIIWMPNHDMRNIVLQKHRKMIISGARCEFEAWQSNKGSNAYKPVYRYWLEIFNVPIHYYDINSAYSLVSSLGDVVAVDSDEWKNDVGCIGVCIDRREVLPPKSVMELHYDEASMVHAIFRVVYSIKLDEFWSVESILSERSYSGLLNELKFYSLKNSANKKFETKYRNDFRDFVDWFDNDSTIPASPLFSGSPMDITPVRATKYLRVNDEVCYNRYEMHDIGCCYLSQTKETILAEIENNRCIIVRIERNVGSGFTVDEMIEELVKSYGMINTDYNWKQFGNDKFIVWMPTKHARDDLLTKCEVIYINTVKCFIRPWSASMNAARVERKFRFWLDIPSLPIHYQEAKHVANFLSGIGSVVRIDEPKITHNCGVISVCVDCVGMKSFPLIVDLVYDGSYIRPIEVICVYSIPGSLYSVLSPIVSPMTYSGMLHETISYMSRNRFQVLMDSKYDGEFSKYVNWTVANIDKDPSEFWDVQ